MCHGWSGSASQFYPLMQLIAQLGFTALAYDHPAHGQSEGEYSHLPGFINAFDELLDTQDNIAGVVAHSMGSASVLESSHDKIQHVPFLLIAPVLNYIDSLFEIVSKSGYSMKLFREIVAELEQQYQYSLDTIDPYQYLLSRKQNTVIVHDKRDRFACFSTSETAANSAENIRLITTQGQGHGRVIHSEETMAAFKSLI
ncbi:MAG: putative alpha/beta hydrolase family esterase [Moritella sp.]|jgi:predicted alpha/beta hydrolase family esterase